jgi:hypothetical protein
MQRVETRRIAAKHKHRRLAIETMRRARRCPLRCRCRCRCRVHHRGLDDELTPACEPVRHARRRLGIRNLSAKPESHAI